MEFQQRKSHTFNVGDQVIRWIRQCQSSQFA